MDISEEEKIKKPRPPIEQLRASGNLARQMMIKKGLIPKQSFIDYLEKKHPGLLPGLPAYLPERGTIKICKRMMYDLLKIWQEECKGDKKKTENLALFIEFATKELTSYIEIAKKEKAVMRKLIDKIHDIPMLGEIFRPIEKYEKTKAIRVFFVDSFAIATWVKKIDRTGDYAVWFLKWTDQMYKVWEEFPKFVNNANKTKTN